MSIFTLRDAICDEFSKPNTTKLHGFEFGDVVSPKFGCDSFSFEYYGSEGTIILQDDIEGLVKIKFSNDEIQVGKASDLDLVRKFNEVNVGPFDIDTIGDLREKFYSRSIGIYSEKLIDQLIDGYFSVPYYIDTSKDIDNYILQNIIDSKQKIASSRISEFWNTLCNIWGVQDTEQKTFLINTSLTFINPSRGDTFGGMDPQMFWDLKNKFEDLITSILKVGEYDPINEEDASFDDE